MLFISIEMLNKNIFIREQIELKVELIIVIWWDESVILKSRREGSEFIDSHDL